MNWLTGIGGVLLPILSSLLILCINPRNIRIRIRQRCGIVLSVSKSSAHDFSKEPCDSIMLLAGLGIEGDSHMGEEVQHLFRRKQTPIPPNLRQVHLIHSELFQELEKEGSNGGEGHIVKPGDLGENITTEGIDLLSLGVGTMLHFINPGGEQKADHAVIRVTGLRNPCFQIEKFQKGLQAKCVAKDGNGRIVERKAGIMTVVEIGGLIETGAKIVAEEPWYFEKMDQV